MILACLNSISSSRQVPITIDIDSDWFMNSIYRNQCMNNVVDASSSKSIESDASKICSSQPPWVLTESVGLESPSATCTLEKRRVDLTDSPDSVVATITLSDIRSPTRRIIFPTLHQDVDESQQSLEKRCNISWSEPIQISKESSDNQKKNSRRFRETFQTIASSKASLLSQLSPSSMALKLPFLESTLCNEQIGLQSNPEQNSRPPKAFDKNSIRTNSDVLVKPPFLPELCLTRPSRARSIFPRSPRLDYYKTIALHEPVPLKDPTKVHGRSKQRETPSSDSLIIVKPVSILRRRGRFSYSSGFIQTATNIESERSSILAQSTISNNTESSTTPTSLCNTPKVSRNISHEDAFINYNGAIKSDCCRRVVEGSEYALYCKVGGVSSKRAYFDPRIWVREFERSKEEMEQTWYSGEDMIRFKEHALAAIIHYHEQLYSHDSSTRKSNYNQSVPVIRGRSALFSHRALRLDMV